MSSHEPKKVELQINHHCCQCGRFLWAGSKNYRTVISLSVGDYLYSQGIAWCGSCANETLNVKFEPSDLYYCLHDGSVVEDSDEVKIITLCPIDYWKSDKCLPDTFYDYSDLKPTGYQTYLGMDATWAKESSKEEIRQHLNSLGFTENIKMEEFLTDCWG